MKAILPFLLLSLLPVQAQKLHSAISPEKRLEIASKHLQAKPNQILLHVKGMICKSCAIGIRKKTKKLNFIDNSNPDKGITISAKHQLLYISTKEGKKIDYSAVTKAVKDAGYTPVRFYIKKKGKIKSFTAK